MAQEQNKNLNNILLQTEKSRDEKIVEILTNEADAERMSLLTAAERTWLFEMLTINRLYFKNSPVVKEMAKDFLHMSVSIDGKLLDNITNIYKSEVIDRTQTINAPK